MKKIIVGVLVLICSIARSQKPDTLWEVMIRRYQPIETAVYPKVDTVPWKPLMVMVKKEDPQFRTYVSLSAGTDYTRDPGFSLEVGRWGIASLATFGVDIDHNYNKHFKEPNTWIGPKVYATVYQKGAFCYMIYGSPKWQLGGSSFLLEYGLSICYNVSDDWIVAFNNYFQSSQQNSFSPGIGLSIVKLF